MPAPLVLPDSGAVTVQVVVGDTRRVRVPVGVGLLAVAGRSRGRCTPVGVLAPVPVTNGSRPRISREWPPPGAQAVPVDGLYEELAAGGFGYGPVFQGLRAAWICGDEVFAEVVLPPAAPPRTGSGCIRRCWTRHCTGCSCVTPVGGVACRSPGVVSGCMPAVRPRAGPAAVHRPGHGVRGGCGCQRRPVLSVESLVVREVSSGQMGVATDQESLFRLDWVPVPVPVPGTGSTDGWVWLDGYDLSCVPEAEVVVLPVTSEAAMWWMPRARRCTRCWVCCRTACRAQVRLLQAGGVDQEWGPGRRGGVGSGADRAVGAPGPVRAGGRR